MIGNKRIHGVTKSEKIIAIYDDTIEKDVIVYAGENTSMMQFQAFKKNKRNYFTSRFKWIKKDPNKTLEETREEWIYAAKELIRETNGVVNLSKTGCLSSTALYHFSQMNEFEAEPIMPAEIPFITGARTGALFFSKQYEGECYKYDKTSCYPSIMQDTFMLFPIKPGRVETVTEPEDYAVAIYHCIIEGSDRRLFRETAKNYYTSQDVRRAKELGYKITMIDDGEPNILIYDRSTCCKTGSQIFRKFVKYFFALKQKKVPFAKDIMNKLWGALCQNKQFFVTIDEDAPITIRPGRKITSIVPVTVGEDCREKIITMVPGEPYHHAWARIGPFLRAKCRTVMSKLIEPILDDVVWFHTDGFICKKKHDELKCGTGLGELRYEGYCEHAIIPKYNNTKVQGIFEV